MKKYNEDVLNAMKDSELLALALKDIKRAKNNKLRVRVGNKSYLVHLDMMEWLDFESDDECTACMAGVVMLRAGRQSSGFPTAPHGKKDYADRIDMMRTGHFPEFNGWQGTNFSTEFQRAGFPNLMPIEFYERMIAHLKEIGH